MEILEIFQKGIKAGIENDPAKHRIEEVLEQKKKNYEDSKYKKYLSDAYLWNPYADSAVLYGYDNLKIDSIAVGIDIEAPELLLIDRLRSKGNKIDLVIGHHPEGKGLFGLNKMISIQEELMIQAGVGISNAEKILQTSVDKYEKSLMGLNYNRAVDAARLLDIPFINFHTPADNMVHTFLENKFFEKKPYKLKDVIDILMEEPEYQYAYSYNNGPKIINGGENSRAGKIYVDVTGGVEASEEIYENLKNKGVDTLVGMHMSEVHLKKAKEANINVVIAGHMSSDTLGVNLLLDEIEKENPFANTISLSGFLRNRRK